jgi:hypothetical protein
MDSIKKKMEKLASETAEAEARIAHFEELKVIIIYCYNLCHCLRLGFHTMRSLRPLSFSNMCHLSFVLL